MAGMGFFDKMPRESSAAAALEPYSGGQPFGGTPRGYMGSALDGMGLWGTVQRPSPQHSHFIQRPGQAAASASVDQNGIRVRQALHPGQRIELNGQILQAIDGPNGFGVYVASDESDDIVDFYSCEQGSHRGSRPTTRSRKRSNTLMPFASLEEDWQMERPGLSRAQSSEGRIEGYDAMPQQGSHVPFDAPWDRPPPPDPLDLKWKAMFEKLMTGSTDGMDDEAKFRVGMDVVVPMLKYAQGIDGPVASSYHARLAGLAEELGVSRSIECLHPSRVPLKYRM